MSGNRASAQASGGDDGSVTQGPTACRLGFGCASLYRLQSRQERLRLLACAHDNGVEHFDTAPMYGLGASERELGAFARRRHGRVALLTKFGRSVGPVGRAARPFQAPLRQRLPATSSTATGDGILHRVDAIIYRPPDYSVTAAAKSIRASYRRLGREFIDILAVHDPPAGVLPPQDLPSWLDDARRTGWIGAWGLAGRHTTGVAWSHQLGRPLPVLQYQSDYRLVPSAAGGSADGYITYGFLRGHLTTVRAVLEARPELCLHWSGRLQVDLGGDGLADALLEYELTKNAGGVVLISSSQEERIARAAVVARRHSEQRPEERKQRATELEGFATACRRASR